MNGSEKINEVMQIKVLSQITHFCDEIEEVEEPGSKPGHRWGIYPGRRSRQETSSSFSARFWARLKALFTKLKTFLSTVFNATPKKYNNSLNADRAVSPGCSSAPRAAKYTFITSNYTKSHEVQPFHSSLSLSVELIKRLLHINQKINKSITEECVNDGWISGSGVLACSGRSTECGERLQNQLPHWRPDRHS